MKPIKKPEFRALKKSVVSQPTPEEVIPVEPAVAGEPAIEQQPDAEVETTAPQHISRYAPVQNYPVIQSVGNTGWQVSDIWRDLRVDSFSN
ncbi:hypothetical protein H6G76_33710 [Nostoc sp. FACHB-152]|uniref:hypothetical protein n=1 Tax=Nostoc sp. FACHB-152 TaxID=2692837 RepID=UPI001685E701|nr:hypothetical protein [Nostoc sp. FACHB-152]MBD2451987.1 hypothetical protein [Nostoc sp. FACHB-152]